MTFREATQRALLWESDHPEGGENPTQEVNIYRGLKFLNATVKSDGIIDLKYPESWKLFQAQFSVEKGLDFTHRLADRNLVLLWDQSAKNLYPATVGKTTSLDGYIIHNFPPPDKFLKI